MKRLARLMVLVQAFLWALLLIVFFVILPSRGFSRLDDFNDPQKIALVPLEMAFIAWSDVIFGVTTLLSLIVLFKYGRTKMPLVVRAALAIIPFAAVLWFIGHDIGFHLVRWSEIERDPASTLYSLDRVLWAFRNGVFFAVTLLCVWATGPGNPMEPAVSSQRTADTR